MGLPVNMAQGLSSSGLVNHYIYIYMNRDSSVGIATRYGLEGPGIESWHRQDFPHPSRPNLKPTESPIQWVLGLSRGQTAGA